MVECSECGEPGADRLVLDAANEPHMMHDICWYELAAWLRGVDLPSSRPQLDAMQDATHSRVPRS